MTNRRGRKGELKMAKTKPLPNPEEVRKKETLSPEDVAVLVGCGRTMAYMLLADGSIPSFTVGRLRRVRRVDVERFIEARIGTRSAPTRDRHTRSDDGDDQGERP